MSDFVIGVFTGVVALATLALVYVTAKFGEATKTTQQEIKALQERMNWLTGAMETHSALMLRLEAKKQGIPMMWWDPNEEDWPKTGPRGTEVKIEKLRIGMNPRDRKKGGPESSLTAKTKKPG